MVELKIGDKAPDFSLVEEEDDISLISLKGKWVVLYFYPKDDTPGCTIEANDFTKLIKEFEKLVCRVLGVSPDNVESHCNFIEKHKLKIDLLCDPDHKVMDKYAVWREKNMYGRKYFGVYRSTFLIDPTGKIAYTWYGVKAEGHAQEVLNKLKELKK